VVDADVVLMFSHFRKDAERSDVDGDYGDRRAHIENIAIKIFPLVFALVLLYVFLVYGALIALMAFFVGIIVFYLIYHGVKAAVRSKRKIDDVKEKRRYYPYDKG
jgi:hypothetical protein